MNYENIFKRTFILCLCLIAIQPVLSQEIFLGAKVGGNLMGLKNTEFDESTGITSFGGHGGLFMELRLKNKLVAFEADLVYNFDQFEGVINTFDTKTNYGRVALPVVLKLYPTQQRFNVQFGTQFAYLVNAQSTTTGQGFEDKFNITNTTNTPDISIVAGLGFDLDRMSITARYVFGVGDFPNTEEIMSGPQLTLGFAVFRGSQLGRGMPKAKEKKFHAPKKKKIGKRSAPMTSKKG